MSNSRSLAEICEKVRVANAVYATLAICVELANESRDLTDLKEKIDIMIKNIRANNSHEFIEWIKRYLNL